ncbi:MAG: chromophore lyase CpcT/CpeT [bacterium]
MKFNRRCWLTVIMVAVVGILVVSAGCVKERERPQTISRMPDLERLTMWMSGSFSSQTQAEQDSSYYDIRLHMKPIWLTRPGGYWMYVEQALATQTDKPYRQRIYHVTQLDSSTFRSEVYELPRPDSFIGAWLNPAGLDVLTFDSLIELTGCAVVLKKSGDTAFVGSTVGRDCRSTLQGASYAVAGVVITAEAVFSWDRGFDAEDKQVWGAERTGYMFRRLTADDGGGDSLQ